MSLLDGEVNHAIGTLDGLRKIGGDYYAGGLPEKFACILAQKCTLRRINCTVQSDVRIGERGFDQHTPHSARGAGND